MSRSRIRLAWPLVGLAFVVAACHAPDGARALLDVPVTGSQERDPAGFNAEVAEASARGLEWPGEPLAVARRFAGVAPQRREAWTAEGEGELPSKLHVIGVVDRFSDDSVRGERFELWLERTDPMWRVARARASWRCWEGRGHQTFGIEPCS